MIKSKKTFKIILIGDSTVGKTSLIYRIKNDSFPKIAYPTIGIDFQTIQIRIDDDHYDVQLWDTAGQERYCSITRNYFRRVDAIAMIYDISKIATFLNTRNWLQSIKDTISEPIPLALIGNKHDLRWLKKRSDQFVPYEQGFRLSLEIGDCLFSEISCKSGYNVDAFITKLVRMIIEHHSRVKSNDSNNNHLQGDSIQMNSNKRKSKKCC